MSFASTSVQTTRHKYLKALHEHTGRNVIAYYSGFLTKGGYPGSEVTDDDKNGLMLAIHELDRSKGLDIILHTQGGSIAAAESIVDYLRKMFGTNIRALVPGMAMSAGTMIALSCREILMGKHSNLGPIDPQIGGIPALGVTQEFERAYREIKADPLRAQVWGPILAKYRPSFISDCENAVAWSKEFVARELENCMFNGLKTASRRAKKVVDSLSDYDGNKRHERHVHAEECKSLGIRIKDIEANDALQDALLSVHHCYMYTLTNTSAFKLIENHGGVGYVRNVGSAS